LIKKASRPTDSENFAWTPLHEASYNGRLELIKALVEEGKETGDVPVMISAETAGGVIIFGSC